MIRSLILIALLFQLSCTNSSPPRLIEHTGNAQGSTYQIKFVTNERVNVGSEIEEIFKAIDESMSMWVETSLISAVNQGDTLVEVDEMFLSVLNRSLEIAEETEGDFDPTIGPLVRLWGFGFDEIRGDISDEIIQDIKASIGYETVHIYGNSVQIPQNGSLDFNAIAQGFTVDYITEFLEEKNIERYMVEVGGEIRAKGLNDKGRLWTIGVDKPQDRIDTNDRFQFILEMDNMALATSGSYRKFWVDDETGLKYSHTINPHTGRPAKNNLLSASIVAPNAMDADAYATVCMVQGVERCVEFLNSKSNLEGYLVYADEEGNWQEVITEGFQEFIID